MSQLWKTLVPSFIHFPNARKASRTLTGTSVWEPGSQSEVMPDMDPSVVVAVGLHVETQTGVQR